MLTESYSEANTSRNTYFTTKQEDVNYMTLEDMLKILKFDNLLSDLDNDLKDIEAGKKSIAEHNEYFNAQVDNKLRKFSKNYHPDRIRNKGGSEKEILQATEMQKKINAVRVMLRHLNENFSQYVGFKYSFFAKIELNILSNEQRLEQISYEILTKLGELSSIKHKKLIPNLNGFLRSSQFSMQSFTSNDLGNFLQGKNEALSYLSNYLSGYKKLVNVLELLQESCERDGKMSYIKPMMDKMLKESNMQLKMLIQSDNLFKQGDLCKRLILLNELMDIQYPYCSTKQDYEYADKYFTLPFMEYVNILFICNEVYLKRQTEELEGENNAFQTLVNNVSQALVDKVPQILVNFTRKGKAIYKTTPVDDKVVRKLLALDNLLLLHKISHYLIACYCYGSAKDGKLAAKLLDIDEVSKEAAGTLLIKIIGIYAGCLAKEFQPEKDFYEKIREVQEEFIETMAGLFNKFFEEFEKSNHEIHKILAEDVEMMKQTNAELRKTFEKMDAERPKRQKLTAKMDAILKSAGRLQGKETDVTQNPQETNCSKITSMLESSNSIGIIEPPKTNMNELQLSSQSLPRTFK